VRIDNSSIGVCCMFPCNVAGCLCDSQGQAWCARPAQTVEEGMPVWVVANGPCSPLLRVLAVRTDSALRPWGSQCYEWCSCTGSMSV